MANVSNIGKGITSEPELTIYLFNSGEYGTSPFIDADEKDHHPVKNAQMTAITAGQFSDSASSPEIREVGNRVSTAYRNLLQTYKDIAEIVDDSPNPFEFALRQQNDIFKKIFPTADSFKEFYVERFKARMDYFYMLSQFGDEFDVASLPHIVAAEKKATDCYRHMNLQAELRAEEIY